MQINMNTHDLSTSEVYKIFNDIVECYKLNLNYVDHIHFYDDFKNIDRDLDRELNVNFTDNPFSITEGKTIETNSETHVFLLLSLLDNFIGLNLKNIACVLKNPNAMDSLKVIFHEFGHAKKSLGKGKSLPIGSDYTQNVKNMWIVLMDEFYAENYVAELANTIKNINWYNLNTFQEERNLTYYLRHHAERNGKLYFNECWYYVHHYYLIPVFQKAGFIFGLNSNFEKEKFDSDIITQVIRITQMERYQSQQAYNKLILELWDEYNMLQYING